MKSKTTIKITKAILWVVLTMASVVFFWCLLLDAIDREIEHEDQIRAERCARMGENIPKKMQHYCDNLGV